MLSRLSCIGAQRALALTVCAFAILFAPFGFAGCGGSTVQATVPVPLTRQQIFSRPVLSRGYEQQQWVLRPSGGSGYRETAASVGAALAGLTPSYVSGLIYLENGTIVTPQMVSDYQTIRTAVLAQNPNAKFDVEMSINPTPPAGKQPFAGADALVAMMTTVNAQLHPDGWWFDFWSPNPNVDWKTAAIAYAHANGQTVGGNVFDKNVPAGSDAVAFVDDLNANSQSGTPFDFNRGEVAGLQAAAGSAILIGHLQSNAQNGPVTESCIYIQQWSEAQRSAYLQYWASQQSVVGFTFMYPVFYPLCPGAYAYDPLLDNDGSGGTLYNELQRLVQQYNP